MALLLENIFTTKTQRHRGTEKTGAFIIPPARCHRRISRALLLFFCGVETLVDEPVRFPVVFPRDVPDRERLEAVDHPARLLVERLQVLASYFVAPLDLAHQQFRVGFDPQSSAAVRE